MNTTEYVTTVACISAFFLLTVLGLIWLLSLQLRRERYEELETGQPLPPPPVYPRTGP